MVNLGELVFSIIAEDKASGTVGAAAAKIGQSAMAIGAGITAVGGAATLLIDRNREMDASFRTTALSMGVPAEAVKELARSLQSVDSPIAEVSASLDILARAGMDNVDSMGQTASAFDTLADGIGVNTDALTGAMVPAFAALNIELADAPQYVDGLATTFRTANVDLADFSQLMTRVGPDLGKMGLGLKDVETILMALAEKGITGRKAMSELSKAIEESGGSSAALYQSLGITNTELGTYNTKLANSAGAAQEFADAQNSAFGTVDALGFELDKLGQAAGDLLAPFEGVTTAALAVGPALTAAGGGMSLLDNEMMMKLFPSLGKVVTGITGAGGLVPALGQLVPALGNLAPAASTAAGSVDEVALAVAGLNPTLVANATAATTASTGLAGFAAAAAAVAVPLVALVATCALLGPAIDAAGQAWIGFLGATKDTTAAVAGVEEQYDETTGAVIRYADAQTEATIIAADAAAKYDEMGNLIGESVTSIGTAEQAYDEFGNAIEASGEAVAGAILNYDDAGQIIAETATAVGEYGDAAAAAAPDVQGAADATENLSSAADGIDTKLTVISSSFGTLSGEAEEYARRMEKLVGGLDTMFGEMAAGNMEGAFADMQYLTDLTKPGGGSKTAASSKAGTGSGSTEPTWAGKGDLDYTGGDPNAWRDDPRLNGSGGASTREYVDAVRAIAPAEREATDATRTTKDAIVQKTRAADELAPILTTVGTATDDVSREQATLRQALEDTAAKCGTTSGEYIALATQAASLGMMSMSTVDALREQATAEEATGTAAASAAPKVAGAVTAVTYLGNGATLASNGLTYFTDAQGRMTDMVMQAPVPLNAEATAMTATATAAAAAGPSILALERATLATATAATAVAPAATGAGIAIAASGASADIAAKKIDAASLAYDAAKQAADLANQKVSASKLAFDAAAGAANANAAQVEAARRAYDNAKQAASDASKMVDESGRALARAKLAAAEANTVFGTTATNLNSVKTSAIQAGGAFTSMGKEYLTARNSIQSNPITSIHTIRTIVEGGGANVAPGASATKYYPKFHEGGTYQAPSGQSEGFAKLLDGERVLSRAETREYEGGGIAAAVAAGIAKGLAAIGLGSGGGDVIVHGNVELSADYPYDTWRGDVAAWKSSRIAKGML